MTPFWEGFTDGLIAFGAMLLALLIAGVGWAIMALFIGEGWALALMTAGFVFSVLMGVWYASEACDEERDRDL